MKNIYVALENIRSLYNVGAIFRTCSFFGVKNILLVGYSGKNVLPNGKVTLHEKLKKTALSSENDLDIVFLKTSQDLINFAQEQKLKIIAVEQHPNSVYIKTWKPKDNAILVFGNETEGISTKLLENSDSILEIKRIGKHNSLNVETTCGIVLAHLF